MLEPRIERHLEVFRSGAEELLPEADLVAKLERTLAEGRGLRIKQGFDPTAPDIHLGHTVGLRKLRDLQRLGHVIVLILGDYTAQVGDPSGRSRTRPRLTEAEVEANARTYLEQFFRVVPREGTEVRRNGEWFARMTFGDILRLTARATVARLLERDDFAERYRASQPIGVHELLYPLMQGWDSVEIRADVEIGGTDQKFNLLMGRTLQESEGQEPQAILTLPLLIGLDGEQRMAKSLGNYVGVSEEPAEQFGKVMSIPDRLLGDWYRLAADLEPAERDRIVADLRAGRAHPMEVKKRLAGRIVELFHGAEAAERARKSFEKQFSRGGAPTEVYEWRVPLPTGGGELGVRDLLVATRLARSGSEAWRKIDEGAVSLDGKPVRERGLRVSLGAGQGCLLRLGRRWVRVVGDPAVESPTQSPVPVPVEGA